LSSLPLPPTAEAFIPFTAFVFLVHLRRYLAAVVLGPGEPQILVEVCATLRGSWRRSWRRKRCDLRCRWPWRKQHSRA